MRAVALGVSALLMLAGAEKSFAGSIRATCTQGGSMVYREDIPEDSPADRRLAIASKNPEAMCVFLKIADMPPEQRVPVTSSSEIPEDVLKGATIPQGNADESLAAALSVLSGKSEEPNLIPLPSFSNEIKAPMQALPETSDRPTPLNLTVGIYRNMEMPDVVAHWKLMQKDTKVLSRMTPSISTVGDVTLLSIEDVPYDDAAELCKEAERHGEGCIAAY